MSVFRERLNMVLADHRVRQWIKQLMLSNKRGIKEKWKYQKMDIIKYLKVQIGLNLATNHRCLSKVLVPHVGHRSLSLLKKIIFMQL